MRFFWNNGADFVNFEHQGNSNRTGFASQTQSKSEVSTWQVRVSRNSNKTSSSSTDECQCPSSHQNTNASICLLFKLRLTVPNTRKERRDELHFYFQNIASHKLNYKWRWVALSVSFSLSAVYCKLLLILYA